MSNTLSSKQPVLVFIHLPKTGGSTLNGLLFGQFPREKVFHILDTSHCETFLAMSDEERDRFDCIIGHIPACIHNFISRPCRYIVLLRDPLERAISDYYYVLTSSAHPRHEEYTRKKMTLEQNLRARIDFSHQTILNLLLYPNLELFPYIPNIKKWRGYESCSMNEIMEQSKRKLREDFFQAGITDRFEDFVLLLARKLGWRLPYYHIKNQNRSRPRTDTLNIAPGLLADFYQSYSAEYQLYEYARSLFAADWSESGISKSAAIRYRMMNRFHGVYRRFRDDTV